MNIGVFIYLLLLVISLIFTGLIIINFRRSVIWLGAITCATAPLRALAIPIQLPLVGLLHISKLSLFLFLILLSGYIFLIRKGRFTLRISSLSKKYVLFILIWLLWLTISLLWSPNLQLGVRYVFTFLLMFSLIIILVFVVNGREGRLKTFLVYFGIVVFLVLLQGLVEKILGVHIPQLKLSDSQMELDPFFSLTIYSFFNQPNDFATFLTICIPFLWLPLFFSRKVWIKIASVMATAVCLYLIFYTVSRINLAVALLIICISPIFAFLKHGGFRIIVGEATIFLVIFVTGYFLLPKLLAALPEGAYIKIIQTSFEIKNLNEDTSTSRRFDLIRLGISSIKDSNLIGLGAGGDIPYLEAKQAAVYNFHSWWLEVLAVDGIFFFLIYLFFYFHLLATLFKQSKFYKNSWLGYLGSACSLSMVGLIIGQNGPSSMIYFQGMWILFGLAITTLNVMRVKSTLLV